MCPRHSISCGSPTLTDTTLIISFVLLRIALSAARLATGSARERLHRCANERCVLLF
jgi:predicted RNA-binding Zn ribbon-like protein